MSEPLANSPIGYEEYAKTYRARVFGGTAILFAGVALILLSGCFQIGVLALMQPAMDQGMFPLSTWGSAERSLLFLQLGMSGVCFLGGMALIGKGFISLSRTLAERP